MATKSKKPDYSSPIFEQLLKPFFEISVTVGELREANRASPVFNHLSAVSESISVLSWIAIDSKPHKHVEESLGSAQYWGNRVIVEHKDK